jgi:D-alanyl-D-alanine carboxypeptidase/D-alanyl-D-alanine-endopeptidase (penicillin-binding protein 4)
VGRGDANLSGRFSEGRITASFEEMADALVRAGVRRIDGRIVGHEGLFKGDRRGEDWGWEDLVWWYGAEVSALSFNDNCADLRLTPGERVGDPARLERNPPSRYYSVVSSVTTSPPGTEEDLTLRRDPGSNVVRLSGTYPLGEKAWVNSVALEDPALYAATVFSEVLAARGVAALGVATTSEALPTGLRVLAEHAGPPLAQVIQAVNKPSQNLHAEILLRLLGARVNGQGTAEAGHAAVKEFLRRIGVAGETSALRDASGLSRSDLIPPHDLVDLLVGMDRHPYAGVFRDSLPVAGVDGSLRNRMKGTRAEGRIVAKTGSIRYVNALAGYATTLGGERLAVAILANHHTGPSREVVAAIDEIGQVLVAAGAPPGRGPAPRPRRRTKGVP